jgi:hypothetical protein
MAVKTRRSKSYRRRHSRRRITRKNGGACPCSMRGQFGGKGGDVGHVYTTGASQSLYQITGTPGLSRGGSSTADKKKRKQKNN